MYLAFLLPNRMFVVVNTSLYSSPGLSILNLELIDLPGRLIALCG